MPTCTWWVEPITGCITVMPVMFHSICGNGGLDIGYQASDNVKIAVGGGSYITFVDEADMELFATMNPQVDPFDIAYTFPITAEVQIGLPN